MVRGGPEFGGERGTSPLGPAADEIAALAHRVDWLTQQLRAAREMLENRVPAEGRHAHGEKGGYPGVGRSSQRSGDLLERAIDEIPHPVLILSPQGRVLWANRAA
ncbi:MAG TPA: hypothetical protein EYH34_12375 [Planctomycetes bacterium]|nr:hypothetical protein [Planctomycetota bacterium]